MLKWNYQAEIRSHLRIQQALSVAVDSGDYTFPDSGGIPSRCFACMEEVSSQSPGQLNGIVRARAGGEQRLCPQGMHTQLQRLLLAGRKPRVSWLLGAVLEEDQPSRQEDCTPPLCFLQ